MIDMSYLQSIEEALKEGLGLECFHRACITTYGMAPPRKGGTALFEGQSYHVEGQATHDFLYFRHPVLNVLVLVVCAWGNYRGEGHSYISLEIAGDADEWVEPGGTRVQRDAEGYAVYQDDNPSPMDSVPLEESVPNLPHGFRAYGGMHGGDSPCQRKFEGDLVSPEALAEVLRHIFKEHYKLNPISGGSFGEYQITGFMPHYCWKQAWGAFYKAFPQSRIKDLARQFYGGEP